MTNTNKVQQLLQKTNTNWQVDKRPLVCIDEAGQVHSTPAYGMFRSDNNDCIGIVKAGYSIFQNSEMAETLLSAADIVGLDVNTRGGALGNGKLVHYQFTLPTQHIGASKLERYITALTSHDGSTAIAFGSCNVVVVCQNTFFKAYKSLPRIKHTAAFRERVTSMADNMRTAIANDLLLCQAMERMVEKQATQTHLKAVVNGVLRTDAFADSFDEASGKMRNNYNALMQHVETEKAIHGNNLYALFNAATRYTNSKAAKHSNDNERMHYLMAGTGAKLSNIAFDTLLQYVAERTIARSEYAQLV